MKQLLARRIRDLECTLKTLKRDYRQVRNAGRRTQSLKIIRSDPDRRTNRAISLCTIIRKSIYSIEDSDYC
jgi:hypothetical protein